MTSAPFFVNTIALPDCSKENLIALGDRLDSFCSGLDALHSDAADEATRANVAMSIGFQLAPPAMQNLLRDAAIATIGYFALPDHIMVVTEQAPVQDKTALPNGRIFGLCSFNASPISILVDRILVAPPYRRRGIGACMIGHLKELMSKMPSAGLEAVVLPRKESIAPFVSYGFRFAMPARAMCKLNPEVGVLSNAYFSEMMHELVKQGKYDELFTADRYSIMRMRTDGTFRMLFLNSALVKSARP